MNFNITAESQFARHRLCAQRPLFLRQRCARCPSAPRDGTLIKLHRKPHPNLKHSVVTAYWKHFSAHHGFWYSSGIGALGGDEYMIGWEEI